MRGKKNAVLIGMPGSGKSTIGVLLAKHSGRDFVDTDVLIQVQKELTLQEIIDTRGYLALREIEEEIILSLECEDCVIATGGSVVYSAKTMEKLREAGTVIFLDVELEIIKERVYNFKTRGIACKPGETFEALFLERAPLYREYADFILESSGMTQEDIVEAIIALENEFHQL